MKCQIIKSIHELNFKCGHPLFIGTSWLWHSVAEVTGAIIIMKHLSVTKECTNVNRRTERHEVDNNDVGKANKFKPKMYDARKSQTLKDFHSKEAHMRNVL